MRLLTEGQGERIVTVVGGREEGDNPDINLEKHVSRHFSHSSYSVNLETTLVLPELNEDSTLNLRLGSSSFSANEGPRLSNRHGRDTFDNGQKLIILWYLERC
jgi:hypothetical protein